jgi:hypothetical protein
MLTAAQWTEVCNKTCVMGKLPIAFTFIGFLEPEQIPVVRREFTNLDILELKEKLFSSDHDVLIARTVEDAQTQLYALALETYVHECGELFVSNGDRPFNPHPI